MPKWVTEAIGAATNSAVHFRSEAVKSSPSCHLTPSRRLKVQTVASSFGSQDTANAASLVWLEKVWSMMISGVNILTNHVLPAPLLYSTPCGSPPGPTSKPPISTCSTSASSAAAWSADAAGASSAAGAAHATNSAIAKTMTRLRNLVLNIGVSSRKDEWIDIRHAYSFGTRTMIAQGATECQISPPTQRLQQCFKLHR